jgi:phosphomannomutase
VYLGDIGWLMLRASGTENMLRIYSETTRAETTKRVLDSVVVLVQQM